MKSKLLNDFLQLCDICGDNVEVVAKLVAVHHVPIERESRVICDFEDWNEQERIEKYGDTIDKILDLPYSQIKQFVACHNIAPLFEIEEHEDDNYEDHLKVQREEKRSHFVNSLFEEYK